MKATALTTAMLMLVWTAAVAQTGPGKPTDLSPPGGQAQQAPSGAGMPAAPGTKAPSAAPSKETAKDKEPSPETTAAVIRVRDGSQVLAKEVIGSKVVGKDGKEVGKVEDLIFDKNGQLSGVVISSGGILGIGSKSIGVNKDAVDIGSAKEQEVVFVNISSQEIDKVPPIMQPPKPSNLSGANNPTGLGGDK